MGTNYIKGTPVMDGVGLSLKNTDGCLVGGVHLMGLFLKFSVSGNT